VIEEGAYAPDFELAGDGGRRIRLLELRGRPVVLYFYPRDDTRASNCSTGEPQPGALE
jgi:thioredoxin-dependent peroxiredoxin